MHSLLLTQVGAVHSCVPLMRLLTPTYNYITMLRSEAHPQHYEIYTQRPAHKYLVSRVTYEVSLE